MVHTLLPYMYKSHGRAASNTQQLHLTRVLLVAVQSIEHSMITALISTALRLVFPFGRKMKDKTFNFPPFQCTRNNFQVLDDISRNWRVLIHINLAPTLEAETKWGWALFCQTAVFPTTNACTHHPGVNYGKHCTPGVGGTNQQEALHTCTVLVKSCSYWHIQG